MLELLARIQDKSINEVISEWHSFWIGFAEGFTFFIKPIVPKNAQVFEEMEDEWHWYGIGRALGLACILGYIARLIIWAV